MANAQGSSSQENYSKEFYSKAQSCDCGYEVSKMFIATIPLQNCPHCNRKLYTLVDIMPNNLKTLHFASKGYQPAENSLTNSTNIKNVPKISSGLISKQGDNIKDLKNEMNYIAEQLISARTASDELCNNTALSNIQTMYSPNIEATEEISNQKQYSSKIDLIENLHIQVISLTLMCILQICFSYFSFLSFSKWNDCPGEEKIPLYLMVESFCSMLLIFQISNSLFTKSISYFHIFICVLGIVFQLAWSVPGYLWIYGFNYDQLDPATREYFCDYKLYTAAYWVLNCSSIIYGLVFTCLCVYVIIISKPLLGLIEVVMGTMISIFIAMVIMGLLKSRNCPFNEYLPVYVTVTGMCGLISSSYIFRTLRCSKSSNYKKYSLIGLPEDNAHDISTIDKCDVIIYISYCLFHLVWFSIGCILVIFTEEPEFVEINDKYCDHSFYMFIYCILSIIALIFGTMLFCIFSFITMFLFAMFCTFIYVI